MAFLKQRAAEEQQRVATARQLVAQAEAARDTDPRTALMLGIAAQRIHRSSETRASLVNTLTSTRYAGTLTGHTDGVRAVAFSPHGHTLATAGFDKTVILWDIASPSRPAQRSPPLTGHTGAMSSAAFSPDGHTLATASFNPSNWGIDNVVTLWDLTDLSRPTRRGPPLTDYTGPVVSMAFSPDGHTLATASIENDNTIILWDLTDPARPTRRTLAGHTNWPSSVAFSPNGHTLATASDDKTVILWDLTDPSRPTRRGPPLTGHTGPVLSVAFSPDGHHSGHRRRRGHGHPVGPHRPHPAHPSRVTPTACSLWRFPPMGTLWPPPAATGRLSYGTSLTGADPPDAAYPSPATQAACHRWPSPPTDVPSLPPAATTRSFCGTSPIADLSCAIYL
jgi:hypothetical protein